MDGQFGVAGSIFVFRKASRNGFIFIIARLGESLVLSCPFFSRRGLGGHHRSVAFVHLENASVSHLGHFHSNIAKQVK